MCLSACTKIFISSLIVIIMNRKLLLENGLSTLGNIKITIKWIYTLIWKEAYSLERTQNTGVRNLFYRCN